MIKVSIMCDSILLTSALEKFLKKYVSTYRVCDVVLTDKKRDIDKPYLIIGQNSSCDIQKPFTSSSLLLALDKFKRKQDLSKMAKEVMAIDKDNILLKKIELLAMKFAKDVIAEIKKHEK